MTCLLLHGDTPNLLGFHCRQVAQHLTFSRSSANRYTLRSNGKIRNRCAEVFCAGGIAEEAF